MRRVYPAYMTTKNTRPKLTDLSPLEQRRKISVQAAADLNSVPTRAPSAATTGISSSASRSGGRRSSWPMR